MKTSLFVMLMVLGIGSAQASQRPTLLYKCANRNGDTLEVRPSAVVTADQAILELSRGGRYLLICRKDFAVQSRAQGSRPKRLAQCQETRGGEGRVLVTVAQGGAHGLVLAYVQQEQAYPLKPVLITRPLVCTR